MLGVEAGNEATSEAYQQSSQHVYLLDFHRIERQCSAFLRSLGNVKWSSCLKPLASKVDRDTCRQHSLLPTRSYDGPRGHVTFHKKWHLTNDLRLINYHLIDARDIRTSHERPSTHHYQSSNYCTLVCGRSVQPLRPP